jgi:hypothetical protein
MPRRSKTSPTPPERCQMCPTTEEIAYCWGLDLFLCPACYDKWLDAFPDQAHLISRE